MSNIEEKSILDDTNVLEVKKHLVYLLKNRDDTGYEWIIEILGDNTIEKHFKKFYTHSPNFFVCEFNDSQLEEKRLLSKSQFMNYRKFQLEYNQLDDSILYHSL